MGLFGRKQKNQTKIELLQGDITELDCDAIVNAANSSLLGGGGVDGAIHEKAGPKLFEECMSLGGCPVGESRITSGYNLKARHVIHAVGPRWKDGRNGEKDVLRDTYSNALKLASENNLKSIAFPNISTGIFRFPKDEAAKIAIETVEAELDQNGLNKVIFVCYDQENYSIYKKILNGR